MIPRLQDYEKIVGKDYIDNLRASADRLVGCHISHVNSTSQGGGVAEPVGAGRAAHAEAARGRVHPGDDGPGCDGLYTQPSCL